MKKALIIGAAGFVGPYLAHSLAAAGWKVTATKLPHERLELPDADVRDMNILNPEELRACLDEEQPDGIFHLAAQSSVALSWKNPDLTIDINVKGAAHLMEAARLQEKKPRILLIGSSEEYGVIPGDGVVVETTPVQPANYYAATKVCQEMIGMMYCKAYGLEVMATRSFNHIGPGQAPVFVVADFCKQVADIEAGKQEPLMRVGNLAAMRDFTDVRDVVEAYRMLMDAGRPGETYNVGSGHAVKIEDLLHRILSLSDRKITVEKDPKRFRPIDVPLVQADIGKLQADTGWKPVIPIEQTIQEILNEWRGKKD